MIYFIIFRARTESAPPTSTPHGVFYYNDCMERLPSILLGIAMLYVFYVLGTRKWDYASEAKREAQKEYLKKAGLSTCYYFIPARRFLLLNALGGGLFVLYWAFKQWQAITAGYKNSAGKMLKGAPWLRALFIVFSFYQLTAIVNRTCLYLRKRPSFSHWLWGTAFWAGLAAAAVPMLPAWARWTGAAAFFFAPYFIQQRINTMPKELPPSRIKKAEILWLPVCWLIWAGIFYIGKMF